jgi:hypothetical protein
LAKEQAADLIFLCVFDPSFVGNSNERLTAAVVQEQQWLGRALLGIAQARAQGEGVEAGAEVRNGPVLETIEGFLRQVGARALVIGEPKLDSALSAFDRGRVHVFAERVEQDTGVKVIVVTPESEPELG